MTKCCETMPEFVQYPPLIHMPMVLTVNPNAITYMQLQHYCKNIARRQIKLPTSIANLL